MSTRIMIGERHPSQIHLRCNQKSYPQLQRPFSIQKDKCGGKKKGKVYIASKNKILLHMYISTLPHGKKYASFIN